MLPCQAVLDNGPTMSRSIIRDGMCIEWDARIAMDDGLTLRADVFRPAGEGKYPVIVSYGPYGKGLSFQQGYKSQWARLIKAAPEVLEGSSNKYQSWEVVDPEKWVPDGYACVGWTPEAPAGRPDSWTCGRRVRRRIFISASNGQALRRGATARSGSTASPTTP